MTGSALVDAIIVMDVETRDIRLPWSARLRRPAVLIGFPADSADLTCIDLDFDAAGKASAEHLAEVGCHDVALIGAPPEVYQRGTSFAQRTQPASSGPPGATGCTRSPGRAIRRRVRSGPPCAGSCGSGPRLDGVLVHNESALGATAGRLQAAGRRVGDDLSVLAICPDDLAEQATPAAHLDRHPGRSGGRRAVALLMAKLPGQPVPRPRCSRRGSPCAPARARVSTGPAGWPAPGCRHSRPGPLTHRPMGQQLR